MSLPPLPVEGEENWFNKRNAFDLKVIEFAEQARELSREAELVSANAASRVASLETLGGVAPGDVNDANMALHAQQLDSQFRAAMNEAAELVARDVTARVDARYFGLPAPGSSADAAPALRAAGDMARELGVAVYVPKGLYYIDSEVDWRYLDVFCEGNIRMRHLDGIGFIVGDTSNSRSNHFIHFASVHQNVVTHSQTEFAHPSVRIVGLKGAAVTTGAISFLQLWADADIFADSSIAYNTLSTQRVNRLELWGVNGSGWVNENIFVGGSFVHTVIGGTYTHNHNVWLKPSVEGSESLIDIQRGSCNVWMDARTEGGTRVKFSENSWKNQLHSLFQSNPSLMFGGFIVEEDLGVDNVVTTRQAESHRAHTLVTVSRESIITNNARSIPGCESALIPSVGVGKLRTPGNWNLLFDTGVMPIESLRDPVSAIHQSPPTRATYFVLTSDERMLRPTITCYGANGQVLPNDPALIQLYSAMAQASNGVDYNTGAAVNGSVISVVSRDVKYIRIRAAAPGDARNFDQVTLTVFASSGVTDGAVGRMKEFLRPRPLYATSRPARGLAWPGTVVQGPTSTWKSTYRKDTALETNAAWQASSIVVQDAAGAEVGDAIGILRNNGQTQWTTIASVNGTQLGLTGDLSSAADAGMGVGIVRWV